MINESRPNTRKNKWMISSMYAMLSHMSTKHLYCHVDAVCSYTRVWRKKTIYLFHTNIKTDKRSKRNNENKVFCRGKKRHAVPWFTMFKPSVFGSQTIKHISEVFERNENAIYISSYTLTVRHNGISYLWRKWNLRSETGNSNWNYKQHLGVILKTQGGHQKLRFIDCDEWYMPRQKHSTCLSISVQFTFRGLGALCKARCIHNTLIFEIWPVCFTRNQKFTRNKCRRKTLFINQFYA